MNLNNIRNIDKGSGFTLIEILIVIAIIGIMTAIVMVAVSSARSDGNDAKVKGQLHSVLNAIELIVSGGAGSYTPSSMASASSTCSGAMFDSASPLKNLTGNSASWPTGTLLSCQATASGWAVSASLSSGYWCVDYSGKAKSVAAQLSSGTVLCL